MIPLVLDKENLKPSSEAQDSTLCNASCKLALMHPIFLLLFQITHLSAQGETPRDTHRLFFIAKNIIDHCNKTRLTPLRGTNST